MNSVELSARNILIIDGNSERSQAWRTNLTKQGYQVRVVNEGAMAIQTVPVLLPDLILLSVTLPDLTGFDVCSDLKSNPEIADIPIIFITDKYQSSELVKAFNNGAIDYLTKTVTEIEMLARVDAQITAYTF